MEKRAARQKAWGREGEEEKKRDVEGLSWGKKLEKSILLCRDVAMETFLGNGVPWTPLSLYA